MNKNLQQRKGFTIIEVVLVLAIAALIILMVFIAWPALQRTQRDQARKNDVALIGSIVGTYKSNNRGNLPNACQLSKLAYDQGTNIYKAEECSGTDQRGDIVSTGSSLQGGGDGKFTEDTGKVYYLTAHKCGANNKASSGATGRQAAVVYAVEANGTPAPQCQDI